MNGFVIQEHPCPRCKNRRTVRVGRSTNSLCFNCRHVFVGIFESRSPRALFGRAELVRLERYRAAVQAGLYSDADDQQASPSATPARGS